MSGAGDYSRRVAFDQPVTTQGDSGEEVASFAEAFKTWAEIEPLTGRELLKAGEIGAEMDTRIATRWSPQKALVNAKWRIRYGSTIYNIAAPPVDVGMAHTRIEIACKSGANQG